MAVANVTHFRIAPGRRDEFVTVAGERDDVIERVGGRLELRRAMVAGEASEEMARIEYFPDPQSRATALDVLSQSPPPGLRELAAASEPPAHVLARLMLDETPAADDAELPPRARILSVFDFEAPPGRYDELEATIASARDLHTSLGARVRSWDVLMAGRRTGQIRYELAHDSYSAAAETARRSHAADVASGRLGPIERLVRGGFCAGSGMWMLVE